MFLEGDKETVYFVDNIGAGTVEYVEADNSFTFFDDLSPYKDAFELTFAKELEMLRENYGNVKVVTGLLVEWR